jgi:tetratricopeptide (TPR) repeat protein/DNA-binding winged helix-turn-helix (wHTH) protein
MYRFGDIEVDPSQACIRRASEVVYLRPKTFQALLYLVENRERLVSKEELFEAVWKDTAVTDDALVQVVVDIRKALGDDPRNPQFIRTFPKLGYRFIAPVETPATPMPEVIEEVTTVELEFEEEISNAPIESPWLLRAPRRRLVLWILALGILGGVLGFRVWALKARAPQEVTVAQVPGKKSVAVMYFESRSEGDELDWLREGLADMLITGLSRSKRLNVLSRQQLYLVLERAAHTPGRAIRLDEALEIARTTKAEAVLLGSFARMGDRLRVDVQVHESHTGQLMVADGLTVDRAEQILSEIELLSQRLSRRMGAPVEEVATGVRSAITGNLEAYRYYSLALERTQTMRNADAIALLEKAVALDPEFALAHARIGYAYCVTWDYPDKAKPHLERAFRLSDKLTEKDRLSISAWYALANLDFPGAIRAYREIIRNYPLEVEAYWRLGHLLAGEEQMDEAIEVARSGLSIDPDAEELYNLLGATYSELGRHDEAIATRQRYVALAPEEPNAHDSLGLSYQWAGRYPEALASYCQALKLSPDFDPAIVHLGNIYFQQGRYCFAIDQYQRYIAVAPSDLERARGYGRIAWVYWKKRDLKSAEQAARQELKFEETAVWNSLILALDRGDFARADKLKEQLAKYHYTSRGARTSRRYLAYYVGYIALKKGKTGEAIEMLKEAVSRRAPIWATDSYEDCLGNAYLELGRLEEATAEYERILRLNPNYPLAQYHLAQAYERKGDRERARAAYERFMQIWKDADPDIPELIEAKARLASGYRTESDPFR